MNRWIGWSACLCVTAVVAFVALPGCDKSGKKDDAGKPKDKGKDGSAHDHPAFGPHGGPLADWGDKYHAEFTVDHAKKQVVVYILDDKAKAAPNIEAGKITNIKVTVNEPKPQVHVELTHDAGLSTEKGIAFIGTHDVFAKSADLNGRISGNVDGKPYTDDFKYSAPKKTAIFTTPGGIYTLADIKANGNTTPDEKFKGIRWVHAKGLQPGDKICPVTEKKAQAECSWIIQGQRYEFCCPPCLDNFMASEATPLAA